MGRQIKVHKDGTFQFWSTTSDQYITEPLTRQESLQFLVDGSLLDHKLRVIEQCMGFPHTLLPKGTGARMPREVDEARRAFSKWHLEAFDAEDYEKAVEEKYLEVTTKEKLQ